MSGWRITSICVSEIYTRKASEWMRQCTAGRKAKEAVGKPKVAYRTTLGCSVLGKTEGVLKSGALAEDLKKKVDLIFTSPPFPLNRKNAMETSRGRPT